MKRINFLFILLTCLLMYSSCSNKTAPVKNQEVLKQPSIDDDIPSEVATTVIDKATITKEGVPQMGNEEEDCHGKRMVSQTFDEAEGSIIEIAGKFVISMDNGNSRYNPCDLAGKYKKEGMLVRFSGESLEIFSGERLFATPFRLKHITEREK